METAQQLTLRDARPTFAAIMCLLLTVSILATRSGHHGLGLGTAFLAANFALAIAFGQAIRVHAGTEKL
jgi:hypothetical protein